MIESAPLSQPTNTLEVKGRRQDPWYVVYTKLKMKSLAMPHLERQRSLGLMLRLWSGVATEEKARGFIGWRGPLGGFYLSTISVGKSVGNPVGSGVCCDLCWNG